MGPFLRGIKLDAKVLFVGYEMIVMMFAFKVAKTRFYLPFKFSKSSWNPLEVSVSFVTLREFGSRMPSLKIMLHFKTCGSFLMFFFGVAPKPPGFFQFCKSIPIFHEGRVPTFTFMSVEFGMMFQWLPGRSWVRTNMDVS